MDEITLNSYAKINLSLQVTGRRPDGYHDILSLMQGIGLCDVINITKCPANGTKYNFVHCIIDDVVVYLCTDAKTIPMDMSNLALKGIKAVLDRWNSCEAGLPEGRPAEKDFDLIVSIDKRLPVAAGIAGGSGNAAVCMLGLNALLGNVLSLIELMEMGAGVGADVPFSIMMNACKNRMQDVAGGPLAGLKGLETASAAAMVSGIGDVVDPVSPMARHIIMANPGVQVSTKAAYEAIDEMIPEEAHNEMLTAGSLSDGSPIFINDFEAYTFKTYPEAELLRSVMKDELSADEILMSGSGPTMVAYYEDQERADRDYRRMMEICREHEGWRCWLTTTGI